jgi:heparin/heparan-sulfate lyase
VPKGDLAALRLSQVSPGAGYVYARSGWDETATHFFFTCGDRFTAHQHLDVGHFLIYRHEELAGDGGHYDGFGTLHDVNYHLRTIAHNTILVRDPEETWPGIRAGKVTGNDGGQHHNWPHHNGAVTDPAAWRKGRRLYDIADLVAFEDAGPYLYAAGDGTRAYSPKKVERFVREIVYLRPGTFVVFDRVRATDPDFKKTWLLQGMRVPSERPPHLVVTNGKGRLFVQALLPRDPLAHVVAGDGLYRYGGKAYPPARDTGPAPVCRIEHSPRQAEAETLFLHVLTATDADVDSVEPATAEVRGDGVDVTVGEAKIRFAAEPTGGSIEVDGKRAAFPDGIVAEYLEPR